MLNILFGLCLVYSDLETPDVRSNRFKGLGVERYRRLMSIPGHNDTSGLWTGGEIMATLILFPAGESQPVFFIHQHPHEVGTWITKYVFGPDGKATRDYRRPLEAPEKLSLRFGGTIDRLLMSARRGRESSFEHVPWTLAGPQPKAVQVDLRRRSAYALYNFPLRQQSLRSGLVEQDGVCLASSIVLKASFGYGDADFVEQGLPITIQEQNLFPRSAQAGRTKRGP